MSNGSSFEFEVLLAEDVFLDEICSNVGTMISGKKKLVSMVNDFEDGQWRYQKFQNFIWDNIAESALSASERQKLPNKPSTTLQECAKKLRLSDDKGKGSEVAEIVLYGIMKHYFHALSVVPKIFYKQNSQDNAKGVDSVHIVVQDEDNFTLWFGEAKFYKSVEQAVPMAIASVKESLQTEKLKKENSIITSVGDLDDLQEINESLNRRVFQSPNRFDVILVRQPLNNASLRFDSIGTVLVNCSLNRQTFVRHGWRIIARSILTGETTELGFIEADSPVSSLKDIALPDGDYEISVLTSSLFWKDCSERIVRTITVGDDIEISALPLIYNLRASISQGFTLIEWSASQNAVDDCLFCMWFSEEPPVDVNRPPDATVLYSDSQTEYRYSYLQSAPAYLAIAAMHSDEHGKIHELFLDWSSVPPRAPDDVVLLDVPLPAVDNEVWASHKDKSDVYLQQ